MENKEYRICKNAEKCEPFVTYGITYCYHKAVHLKVDSCIYLCSGRYRCVEVILKDNNIQKVVKK